MFRRLIFRLMPNGLLFYSLLLVCFVHQFAYSQISAPQNLSEATTLELNKPIEHEISGAQKHTYQIPMSANQYAKVLLEKLGVDVVARQINEDGKIIAQYDSAPGTKGVEEFEIISKTAKNYFVTVETRQRNLPLGNYKISLTELRSATEKEIAIDDAAKLLTQANQLWRAGNNDEALPLAEQSLAILEKELGENDDQTSQALVTVANIVSDKGDLNKAETLYLRALKIKENLPDKDEMSISFVLNNLGILYKDKGDYIKAESFYLRALEIREKYLDPNHLLIASVLNNLGSLSNSKGDINKAEFFYKRVLEIRENALGLDHPDVATALNNLANLYPDVAKAEPLYNRALAIREKQFGPMNQAVAQTLYNMAALYSNAGNYAKAEPLCQRAVSIFEKTLGADHPYTSYPINLLAALNKQKGDYVKSEQLYQRAIAIKEKSQGIYHPDLAGVYANLSNLYVVKNDFDKALDFQTKANNIYEYNLALNLTTGSEREKFYYLKSLSLNENQTLSLNFQTAPNSLLATNLAVTTVLQRKGRVLDAMSDSLGTLRHRFNKQDQLLLDQLNEVTAKIVAAVSDGSNGLSPDEYRNKINILDEQREKIESEIGRASAGFYEQSNPVTLKAIQDAIPANTALIEFAAYRPISPEKFEFAAERMLESELTGAPRYVVFVISPQGAVKAKDLGTAKEIDQMINGYRLALRDPKRNDIKQLARTVDEKLMQPVRTLLGDAKHLLISPDGELNLIPFEALVDEKGKYLVENYAITYLTSGRDLLRMQTKRNSKSKFLIVANPLFGELATEQTTTNSTGKTTSRNKKRQSITSTRNLSETYFAPLSGTEQEARAIQTLFPDATILTEKDATKTALEQVAAPQILHIATHGFFLEDAKVFSKDNVLKTERDKDAATDIENPLLHSGLALAGANQHNKIGDDGILTALEASELNLWGTKLVVLSACDTGLGEVENGEGVYGLRRAFVLAGTESLVMSLWSVSDYVTRELMTNYYKNLKQGMGRGESLRQVQLQMLKNPNRQHPFYWASFIQSGEWANLEGKR